MSTAVFDLGLFDGPPDERHPGWVSRPPTHAVVTSTELVCVGCGARYRRARGTTVARCVACHAKHRAETRWQRTRETREARGLTPGGRPPPAAVA